MHFTCSVQNSCKWQLVNRGGNIRLFCIFCSSSQFNMCPKCFKFSGKKEKRECNAWEEFSFQPSMKSIFIFICFSLSNTDAVSFGLIAKGYLHWPTPHINSDWLRMQTVRIFYTRQVLATSKRGSLKTMKPLGMTAPPMFYLNQYFFPQFGSMVITLQKSDLNSVWLIIILWSSLIFFL